MDEELQPIEGTDLARSAVSPEEERSPQDKLLQDIVDNSYAKFETWSQGVRGSEGRGRGSIQSEDEMRRKVKKLRINNPTINWILNNNIENLGPEKLISIPFDRGGVRENKFLDARYVNECPEQVEFIKQNPIAEVAYLGPVADFDVKEESYVEERRVWEKNIFGRERPKTIRESKTRKVGQPETIHQVPFNSVVVGDAVPTTDELAVIFHYVLSTYQIDSIRRRDKNFNPGFSYLDPLGREGNYFSVTALLPGNIGEKLQVEFQKNPLFVRNVAMELVDRKFSSTDNEGAYNRPPYDQMFGKGLKMYTAFDFGKPLIPTDGPPHVFDPTNVVDIDSLTSTK